MNPPPPVGPYDYLTPVLTVIVSLVTSGVLAAWLTHRLGVTSKEREFRRQKLEQVYLSSRDWQEILVDLCFLLISYHDSNLNLLSYRDQMAEAANKNKDSIRDLTMLTNLYFPELVPFINKIENTRDRSTMAASGHILQSKPPDPKLALEAASGLEMIRRSFVELDRAIFTIGQRMNKIHKPL